MASALRVPAQLRAGLLHHVGRRADQAGQLLGMPDYVAPKQISGRHVDAHRSVRPRVVAYALPTDSVSFKREVQLAVLYAHLSAPSPRVTTVRTDLAETVDQVMVRRWPRSWTSGPTAAASSPTCCAKRSVWSPTTPSDQCVDHLDVVVGHPEPGGALIRSRPRGLRLRCR